MQPIALKILMRRFSLAFLLMLLAAVSSCGIHIYQNMGVGSNRNEYCTVSHPNLSPKPKISIIKFISLDSKVFPKKNDGKSKRYSGSKHGGAVHIEIMQLAPRRYNTRVKYKYKSLYLPPIGFVDFFKVIPIDGFQCLAGDSLSIYAERLSIQGNEVLRVWITNIDNKVVWEQYLKERELQDID